MLLQTFLTPQWQAEVREWLIPLHIHPLKHLLQKKLHWAEATKASVDKQATYCEPLVSFPANDNPASENHIKTILLSLQADLHDELHSSISHLSN